MARKPSGSLVSIPSPATNRARLDAMSRVAGAFKSFRPAVEVVRRVEGVPTIFVDLDRMLGCGGLPTSRVIVVHGPANAGKTALTLGLGLSFLRRDHFFGLADLEHTTPTDWLEGLYGEAFRHPGFVALSGDGTFENVRDGHREFFEGVAEGRRKGDLPPETRAVTLVDSIKKLMPKKLWEELDKAVSADASEANKGQGRRNKKPKGIDGAGGRAGQIKAAYLSAWFDELAPLLATTLGTVILIARESVTEEQVGQFTKEVITLGGGNATNFESSATLRVTNHPIYEEVGKEKQYVGERHVLQLRKTKVAAKDERMPEAVFHTSNGALCPAGYDPARDLLVCALELGVVEVHGSHYSVADARLGSQLRKLGQGQDSALLAMREPMVAGPVEAYCRERMFKAASAPA